ncbi:hypothetical protein HpHA304_14760 [Helicobacter pylori]
MKENYTKKTAGALEQLDKIVETEQKNQQTKLNKEIFKNDLSECFENIEEKRVRNSFISWFNDGSHGISDDLFVQSQDTSIETYLKVFENIFKKTGHEAHYKMMMGIK